MQKLLLYKLGQIQEDFEYVYSDIKVIGYVTDDKKQKEYNNRKCIHISELNKKNKCFIVICDKENKYISHKFNKIGLIQDVDYMYIENYLKLLDDNISPKILKNLDELRKIHFTEINYNDVNLTDSEMFIKMMNMEPRSSLDCTEPFRFAQIQSDSFVYPCCKSWATEYIGNAYAESLNDIWNSRRARLFRLSIINKTYAFCNLDNCPLQDNGKSKKERATNIKENKYPECLSLAMDQTCNLKCRSCRNCIIDRNDNPTYKKVYNKITKRIFKDKWIPKVCTLLLPQNGEAFDSDAYKKILFNKKTKKTHSIVIHTNGLALNKEMLAKLAKVNKKYLGLFLSIDSINEETYKKLRGGADFKTLMENLKFISKARNKGELEYVRVLCVLQRDNYKELPAIAKLTIDLKFDYLDVTRVDNWGFLTDEEFKKISMYDDKGNPLPELVEVLKDPIFKSKEIEFIGNVLKNNNN